MPIIQEAIKLIFTFDKTLTDILIVTLKMSISSSVIALIIGVPIGVVYGYHKNKICKFLIIINRTLMGMPPVVCGLFCFLLFCGVGPLRHMKLLYTIPGMVIAQVILITPIVIGTLEPFVEKIYPDVRDTIYGLKIARVKKIFLLINESKYEIISIYLIAFSRAIAEVGAVSMVGGAIIFKTNVMTTAIMNYTNMGNFNMAMALGIILLLFSFVVNIIATLLQILANK
ncbi:MAG: ABC transporter permease [Eubacteriales bacterium]|nr:ABC transporter permease [Eubacteriales bacterium]